MSDYIRREDAVDLINKISNLDAKAKGGICVSLANLKKADVVPVVRCKDCKLCDCNTWWCDRGYIATKVKPDDFCSYGERKE